MPNIRNGVFETSQGFGSAKGGTELLTGRLLDKVPSELLEGVQIHISRVTEAIDPSLTQIIYLHDLPEDPAAIAALAEGNWRTFKVGVFVSHWQRQAFHEKFNIPYSWSTVIENAITPMELSQDRNDGKMKFIYTSTPHRGLNLLYPVFDALTKVHENLVLDVYSSFALYGWKENDKPFEPLFKALESHPNINYHGTKSNDEVRWAVSHSDVWVLPSIWKETSCLAMIEAMSAGLACVHSSLAALPETAKGLSWMYIYNDNADQHMDLLYHKLSTVIQLHQAGLPYKGGEFQKNLTDHIHRVDAFGNKWSGLLKSIKG